MIPYLILYLVHGLLRIIVSIIDYNVNGVYFYDSIDFRYFGYTFFYGPGMWFIPVIFGTILVFPILYYCFDKKPTLTVVCTYIIEFGTYGVMIITGFFIQSKPNLPILFLFSVFSMFSAIGIGLWLSKNYDFRSKKNLFLWILFPISLIFMILYNVIGFPFTMAGDYHMFFFPYSAIIIMLALKFIPNNPTSKFSNFIRKISKSTYHILLSQILYYSIVYQFFLTMYDGVDSTMDVFDANPINYLWYYPLSLFITFAIGILWKSLEDSFYLKCKSNLNYQKIYKILIRISLVAYIAWYCVRLVYLFVL